MNTIVAPVVVFLGTPLLAAVLSFATTHTRVLHGLNLATMTCLVVSEIALVQEVLAHGPLTALWELVYIDALSAFWIAEASLELAINAGSPGAATPQAGSMPAGAGAAEPGH